MAERTRVLTNDAHRRYEALLAEGKRVCECRPPWPSYRRDGFECCVWCGDPQDPTTVREVAV